MTRAFDLSVYGILDPERSRGRDLAALADAAVKGGATFLQLRNKQGTTRDMVAQARAILDAIEGRGVPLVINDRIDVALAAGADGVHIGEDDMAPEDARRLLGADVIVGLTIHSTGEARAAPVELADYYGVGAVYVTRSKTNPNPPIGLDGFAAIAGALRARHDNAPVVGIAGIEHGNAADVITAGADGVAVISCLFMADDVEAATQELARTVAAAKQGGRP
ncbi:MAG: thiamine phosphate synthase [Hyphomicrobiales bacterium]